MPALSSAVFSPCEAPQDPLSRELTTLAAWVMQTFDRAIAQLERDGGSALPLLHAAVSVRAALIPGCGCLPSSSIDSHRRSQLQRLGRLAPAAVDWVARHAESDRSACCREFRRHLLRRCELIIREAPRELLNEE